MPITVNLDDEAIDFIAARIALKLAGMDSSQSVNPPQQNTHRTQTAPVSEPTDSGWSNESAPAPEPERPAGPRCEHGDMKWVPGGVSKRTGNSYQGFWGCSAPRGTACKGQL